MVPHDSVKKVYLLLALGALVVTLVGVFAGKGDKYFVAPNDSRTSPVKTPPERRYNVPHDAPLDLPVNPVWHVDLDLRRLARTNLHMVLCQEHGFQGMSGGILPVSVPRGAAVQDRRERLDVLATSDSQSAPALSEPDPGRLSGVLQGMGGDHDSELREVASVWSEGGSVEPTVFRCQSIQ